MLIPATLRAGDTWTWTDTVSDYPAPTWTLHYALRGYGLSVIDIAAAASGANHVSTVAAATSTAYLPGDYSWTAYVTHADGRRFTVDSGTVTVLPDLSIATAATDNRSHAVKTLAALEAMMAGQASKAQMSMTVNGRSIQYLKLDEIIKAIGYYRGEVNRERQEEKIASGADSGRLTRLQFGSE